MEGTRRGPRPLLDLLELLQMGKLALACIASVHMDLEGDTLGQPERAVEQHGKRFASFLTVHVATYPQEPWAA